MFKKNDYIVCLRPKETSTIYIRRGWVYKQYIDSDRLQAVKSSVDTGHVIAHSVLYNQKDRWRYATDEEIKLYKTYGKPYPILKTGDKVKLVSDAIYANAKTAKYAGKVVTVSKVFNNTRSFEIEEIAESHVFMFNHVMEVVDTHVVKADITYQVW
jgi:hypothetical protein